MVMKHCGAVNGRLASHGLVDLLHRWHQAFNSNNYARVVFVDYARAILIPLTTYLTSENCLILFKILMLRICSIFARQSTGSLAACCFLGIANARSVLVAKHMAGLSDVTKCD